LGVEEDKLRLKRKIGKKGTGSIHCDGVGRFGMREKCKVTKWGGKR